MPALRNSVIPPFLFSPILLISCSFSARFQVKDPSIQGGQFYLSLPLTDAELAVIRSIANVRS